MATAELCGTNLSELAAQLLSDELQRYDEVLIRGALARCRRELKGRLTVAEILGRIEDGRPAALQAWGQLVWDEFSPYSPTDEMAIAQGECRTLYLAGDKVGARMIFVEAYSREVLRNRAERKPIITTQSLPSAPMQAFTGKDARKDRDESYARKLAAIDAEEEKKRKSIAAKGERTPMPDEVRALMRGLVKEITS